MIVENVFLGKHIIDLGFDEGSSKICKRETNEKQEVKVIWQKAPHGGPIPRLGVTPGGRKLYHWIHGVGFPISVT